MNGYFQLLGAGDHTNIKLIPPTDGGKPLDANDVIDYLSFHKIDYDIAALNRTIVALDEETVIQLNNNPLIPISEELKITIDPDRMVARGVFICASDKGMPITKDEILSDLKFNNIVYGIKESNIDAYLNNKNYLEEIILAKGKEPRQGYDASIEYFFNTDPNLRPQLNDDGSVDFFNLNIINHINEGDLLARLTREDKGDPGTDVCGGSIPPRKVTRTVLRFGRNIRQNEDKTEIYAECAGHVNLVDGRVFVSNVMEVENVDPATGNIEYDGNVLVNGNVCSNFSVKAKGDVEVRGVVEGATVEAGGSITIARGMNGMGKGILKCGGNVIAKFIENSEVEAEGYVESGSIIHSTVVAGTEVHVQGKKGFISGGKVTATTLIDTRILGSDMGTSTIVEVGLSALTKKRYAEVEELIKANNKIIDRVVPIMEAARERMQAGQELSSEQIDNIKGVYEVAKIKKKETLDLIAEKEELESKLLADTNAKVVIKDTVYPGTKIVISDVSKIVKDSTMHCMFQKNRGDVKMYGL